MNLTELQKTVVDYIRDHPGATSPVISDGTGHKLKSVAAALSAIVRDHPRVLVRESLRRDGKYGAPLFAYRIANGSAGEPSAPLRTHKRHRRAAKAAAHLDVLLTLKIGRREAMTISIDEARDLLQQLLALQRYFTA